MPRAQNGPAKLRKKRRLLRRAKGFRGGRGKLLRTVKETLIRGEAFATSHRRKKKGDWRGVWIVRLNAALKTRGINYSCFIAGLRKAHIDLNRKMLSEIAIRDSSGFDALVTAAKDSLGKSNLPGEKRTLPEVEAPAPRT